MHNATNAIDANKTKPTPAASRWDPRTWGAAKKAAAGGIAAVVAVSGWALFRPELLFVNRSVNETLAAGSAAGAGLNLLSMGGFSSLGHHTEGKASLYQGAGSGGAAVLRLSEFRTSNGPDVHVYLVEGADGANDAAIKAGRFLDLGVLKGNIGDQNYNVPAGTDLSKYGSVSIWCKRFAVNFAAASLGGDGAAAPAAAATPAPEAAETAAAAAPAAPLTVTTGEFHKVAHKTAGRATITEDDKGKRLLTLTGFETAKGPKLHVYLVAALDAKDNDAAKKLVDAKKFVNLGALKSTTGEQAYEVPGDIDLWEYLSVVVWCDQFDVSFGAAPLAAPGASK